MDTLCSNARFSAVNTTGRKRIRRKRVPISDPRVSEFLSWREKVQKRYSGLTNILACRAIIMRKRNRLPPGVQRAVVRYDDLCLVPLMVMGAIALILALVVGP